MHLQIYTHYFVDQAVSLIFCVFIIFILYEFHWYLAPNLRKILNENKISSCQPKPERNTEVSMYQAVSCHKSKLRRHWSNAVLNNFQLGRPLIKIRVVKYPHKKIRKASLSFMDDSRTVINVFVFYSTLNQEMKLKIKWKANLMHFNP